MKRMPRPGWKPTGLEPAEIVRQLLERGVPLPSWALLLDSSERTRALGRYSYLLPAPREKLIWHEGRGHFGDGDWKSIPNPWAILKAWLHENRREHDPNLPPFQGG